MLLDILIKVQKKSDDNHNKILSLQKQNNSIPMFTSSKDR